MNPDLKNIVKYDGESELFPICRMDPREKLELQKRLSPPNRQVVVKHRQLDMWSGFKGFNNADYFGTKDSCSENKTDSAQHENF